MANKLGIPSANNFVPLTDGSTMPAGTIISYAGSIAAFTSTAMADSTTLIHKDGWAVCNGASVPKATYSQLFARVSTTWNAATNPLTGSAQSAPADATNNFRVPNLQGTFLRGVGDFTDNTKDTTLAGFQASQNLSHNHADITAIAAGGSATANRILNYSTTYGGAGTDVTTTSVTGNNGAAESRPQNVGVYYLIKLYDNLAAVDVYVPSASAGVSGLVDNSSGNTAGTPIKGKTDGVAVGAGYVGEVFSLGSVSTGNLTNDVEVTVNFPTQLPAGNWQIFRKINVTAQTPTGVFRLRTTLSNETTLYSAIMSTAGVASGNGINTGAVGAYKNSTTTTVTATVIGWFGSGTWNPSIDGYAVRIA